MNPSPNAPTPSKQPKKRRWIKYLLATLALGFVGLMSGVYWLFNTNSGLHFTVHKIPTWAGMRIQTQTLYGTIWQGFSGSRIQINTESADIEIQEIHWSWQPKELLRRHLHIQNITIGDMRVASKPTPPRESQALKLPEDLSLPFSVAIDSLNIGKITPISAKNQENSDVLSRLHASYFYDHDHHRLNIQALDNAWLQAQGHFNAAANAPFALSGSLKGTGELDAIAINSELSLSGSLNNIALNAALSGNGIGLNADTHLRPFETSLNHIIGDIHLQAKGINPHAFIADLPKAQLDFNADIKPVADQSSTALNGAITLRNHQPHSINQNGIPVQNIAGGFTINEQGKIIFDNIETRFMRQGKITLNGDIDTAQQRLNLVLNADKITATDLLTQNTAGTINGKITAQNTWNNPHIAWQLDGDRTQSSGSLNITTDTAQQQRTLHIKDAFIRPKNGGNLHFSGSYELFQNQKITAKIQSQQFNPAHLYPTFPDGKINGNIELNGFVVQQKFDAKIQFHESQLSGAPLSGNAIVSYHQQRLYNTNVNLLLGTNRINAQGAFGKKGDTLALNINAPELHRFGFGIKGALTAKGTLTSTRDDFSQLDVKLSGNVNQFALGNAVQAQYLDFTFVGSPQPDRPLDISLKGKGINASGTAIDHIDTALKGTLRNHHLRLEGSLKIDDKPLNLNAQANGGLNDKNQWLGKLNVINVGGALNIKLQNPTHLEAGAQRVVLGASKWQTMVGGVDLERLIWSEQTGLSTKGRAQNIQLSQLHPFYSPPIAHDLVLSGDWDLQYGHAPSGYLNLRQHSGDITLNDARKTTLQLSQLTLKTQFSPRGILNTFNGNTRFGKTEGTFNILQTFGGDLTQAPIEGRIMANAESLDGLRHFMPIGQSVQGAIKGDIRIGGRLSQPQFSGSITGERLNYHNREIGVILSDGSLKSRLEGQRWIIDALTFHRKEGSITLSGNASYINDTPDVNTKIVFQRYPILDQFNRRLLISGSSHVLYTKDGVSLIGELQTDEGRFGIQDNSAPTLDNDVIVLGDAVKEPSKPLPLHLDLRFDLNDRFYFSGQGLNVNLGGKLRLTAKPNSDIQAVGSVNVIKGQYKAYGQDLRVTKGVISFVGPLNSPNLNIRAERRNSPVGAGVEVLGNLNTPRITLVSNEPMSEKDKLSWLILNRASSGNSTDEAALATAAGAFLAGSLNDKIGLVDDFGLTSQQTRDAQTGEMNPAQQVLTFGKQLTQNLYMGYEAGIQTASQSVKLVYQISRSFQAIARAGTESSGGEIKYIKRFD